MIENKHLGWNLSQVCPVFLNQAHPVLPMPYPLRLQQQVQELVQGSSSVGQVG
jgi:hypothetical protein